MTSFTLSINPALDISALAAAYARDKFVQIPEFFAPETAAEIDKILRERVDYRMTFVEPELGVIQMTQQEVAALPNGEMQTRLQSVLSRAARNVGFFYFGYPMNKARKEGLDPGHPIHAVTDFINSRAFLDFGASVIGETGITQADAQATLFTSGNFLTRHIDEGSHNERRAAYTLGFSKNWQTDWGGQLQFIDKETTDVTSAWIPRWNTLSLFDGRSVHAVSPISQFAPDGRYSIVGWLRDDPVQ